MGSCIWWCWSALLCGVSVLFYSAARSPWINRSDLWCGCWQEFICLESFLEKLYTKYINKKVCYRWLHSTPRVKRVSFLLGGQFLNNETLWQTFNGFWWKFLQKTTNLGKLGVTHDLGWLFIGKLMIDFLFALLELFPPSIMVPELWGKMCKARLFSKGSTSLHSNFTWTGSMVSMCSFCHLLLNFFLLQLWRLNLLCPMPKHSALYRTLP